MEKILLQKIIYYKIGIQVLVNTYYQIQSDNIQDLKLEPLYHLIETLMKLVTNNNLEKSSVAGILRVNDRNMAV